MEPRPYQVDAVEGLREEIRRGSRKVLLQAATGSGKTMAAAMVVQGALAQGNSVLFLAHRRELIYQARERLEEADCPAGIIMAGELPLARHVQVASVQTLWARREREGYPSCDVMVIDECHLVPGGKAYQAVMDANPGAVVVGLTATPIRTDGRGLGEVFDSMVQCPSIAALTEMGYLVPLRYFAPSQPDLEGIRTRAGDYVEGDLAERMDKPTLIGDVVEHWGRFADGRPTIVFASGVKHSIHLAEQFRGAGVRAEHVDGTTAREERDGLWRRLANGDVQVVTNVGVAVEGLDVPAVSAIVLARPTKSPGRFLQMLGRGMRTHPGKEDCVVIDHAGAVFEHGFAHEFFDWSLGSIKGETANPVQRERVKKSASPIVCGECFATFTGSPKCPNCGHEHSPRGEKVAYVHGTLGEVRKTDKAVAEKPRYTPELQQKWWGMLEHYPHHEKLPPGLDRAQVPREVRHLPGPRLPGPRPDTRAQHRNPRLDP